MGMTIKYACIYIYIYVYFTVYYIGINEAKNDKRHASATPFSHPGVKELLLDSCGASQMRAADNLRRLPEIRPFENCKIRAFHVSLQKGVSRASSFQTSACCRRLSTQRSLDTTGVVSAVRLGHNSIHPFIPQERKSYISQRLKAI